MIEVKKKYLSYLSEIENEIEDLDIENKVDIVKKSIREVELLIPVVGGFSAGKSTLLNSFLEKDILSVGMTPETAIATELRFSEDERIEAVKKDDSFDVLKVEDLKDLNVKNYKYIRLYLNNKNIKDIEPLILVDMPGFDSPYDAHNEAIFEYMQRGVHFLFLVSVEDGTLTGSMLREVQNILEYEREVSFFLSKSNLKADSEILEIKEKLEELVVDELGISAPISQVGLDSKKEFQNIINSIDIDNIYKKLFFNRLKNLYFAVDSSINSALYAYQQDKEKSQEAIEELSKSLESLKSKKDDVLKNLQNDHSNINKIIDSVIRSLTNQSDSLINLLSKGDKENATSEINQIVKSALIPELKRELQYISEKVVANFSIELNGLQFDIDNKWIDNTTMSIKNSMENGANILGKVLGTATNGSVAYKTISTVLAISTNILAPILELIITFLPDILSLFVDKDKQQREKAREVLYTHIFPQVRSGLREALPKIFNEEVQILITQISAEFESKITKKQDELDKASKEKVSDIDKCEEKITLYSNAQKDIKKISNEVLYNKILEVA